MAEIEKAIKAGENILDGMRFDNLNEQREVIKALKRYRKGKLNGKDLTLEERIILLEIRARTIEPLAEKLRTFRNDLILIYVSLLFCFISIFLIISMLKSK